MWAKSLWSFRIITLIGKIIYLKGWVRNMSSGFFRCVFFFFYFCAPQSPEAGSQTLFSRATAQKASVTADLRVARLLLLSLCSSGDFQNTLLCCLWAFPLPHSVSVHSLGPQPQLSLLMSFFLRVEALFCLVFHTLICSPDFRDYMSTWSMGLATWCPSSTSYSVVQPEAHQLPSPCLSAPCPSRRVLSCPSRDPGVILDSLSHLHHPFSTSFICLLYPFIRMLT